MCSKVDKDHCAENPEFDFINKTLACKNRALNTKQALELTVWLLVNINFRGKANHFDYQNIYIGQTLNMYLELLILSRRQKAGRYLINPF